MKDYYTIYKQIKLYNLYLQESRAFGRFYGFNKASYYNCAKNLCPYFKFVLHIFPQIAYASAQETKIVELIRAIVVHIFNKEDFFPIIFFIVILIFRSLEGNHIFFKKMEVVTLFSCIIYKNWLFLWYFSLFDCLYHFFSKITDWICPKFHKGLILRS